MAKFNTKKKNRLPSITTASLPDIVFMLLFFFMTVTVMKNDILLVQNKLPFANQIQKLDKKNQVIYIYAGQPNTRYQSTYGTAAKIQLNDKLVDVNAVFPYILEEKAKRPQQIRNLLTVALKVDAETNMGLISDIKQEIRKTDILKINYTTKQGDIFKNIH